MFPIFRQCFGVVKRQNSLAPDDWKCAAGNMESAIGCDDILGNFDLNHDNFRFLGSDRVGDHHILSFCKITQGISRCGQTILETDEFFRMLVNFVTRLVRIERI